jgi:hypothetical protein
LNSREFGGCDPLQSYSVPRPLPRSLLSCNQDLAANLFFISSSEGNLYELLSAIEKGVGQLVGIAKIDWNIINPAYANIT